MAGTAQRDGLLGMLKPGSVWVDMTTTSKAAAVSMASTAKQFNVQMAEAPVTGGADGAWAGPGERGCRGGYAVLLLGGPRRLLEDHPFVGGCLAAMGETQRCGDKVRGHNQPVL